MSKFLRLKTCKVLKLIIFFLLFFSQLNLEAQTKAPLRRPVSPSSPMWLIHIDTWNYADPQKIIDLIPQDIRPYVVMNISLSISHDVATSRFQVAEYGYEIAKSWVKTCAQNQMWATVQPSSGGFCQFSDYDLSVYEEFYRDYPNFIGFNYAEQFWGFDDATDPLSSKWMDRMTHFANLLKLSSKYGGYLVVSWCGNQWSPSINPIAMLKRNSAFALACKQYTENYILCEKYTQQSYQYDMESVCLGAYLSGYSGQYGCRYDDTGWTDPTGTHANFTMATSGAVNLEHIMLTGQTVLDGPELIWTQCFRELSKTTTSDGYLRRNWGTFPQFDNVNVDIFRKVLDGTVRIPTRKEVIDRTKVVIVNDANTNDNNVTYSSPQSMFEGLYRMDGDGNYENNKTFFKKTGRYPSIPTVFELADADANSFQTKVNRSAYDTRWPNISSKVTEFNNLFAKEYTGDIYAGRHENGWVVYNPYKTGQIARGTIPFKYNTCDSMGLVFSQYTSGVVKEISDKVTFYLCNYDNEINLGLKTDSIRIYGSSAEPTWSYVERGNHQASTITKDWTNGVFTLVIKHNGSLDVTINCSGTAAGRNSSYTAASLIAPLKPSLYTGARQYEAECFDHKNVSGIVTGGYSQPIRNYTGQGYLKFGTNSTASVRDTVSVLKKGIYKLQIRYSTAGGAVNSIDLYVNGTKVGTPTFSQTASESEWAINTQNITLNAGANSIEFKANSASSYAINFDNVVVLQGNGAAIYDFTNDNASTAASTPAAQFISVQSGSAGVISYTDANSKTSNCFKTYSAGATNGTGVADLDLFPSSASDYSIVWKEFYGAAEGKKGVLLRGTGANGSSTYASGMKQGYLFITLNNSDNTVTLLPYIATADGLTPQTPYTSAFKINASQPCWYRASAVGNTLKFECSADSVNWEGGNVATFTSTTYTVGSTQLVWGLNANNLNWMMDNLIYLSGNIAVSKYALDGFSYTIGLGPSTAQSFILSGSSLTDNILIKSTENYEISLNAGSGYTSTLTLNQNGGNVPVSTIYTRLKPGLTVGSYTGEIQISANGTSGHTLNLKGTVQPQALSKKYNFSNDVATTTAQTPPALNATIGSGNTATAGVVSFTDSKNIISNMLKPYAGGNRNATGIVDLNLFSRKGTDYTVTWKQCVGSSGADYKVGVLLRGDTLKIGDATTGYVQGMMQGYLFLAYTAGAAATPHTEFRIYKSTAAYNSLSMLVNTSDNSLVPASKQPVWYRASVSGTSTVSLKLEYSTDSITWKTGSSTSDNTLPFTSGASQLVWGLGVGNVDFYMDDIIYYGIDANATLPDDLMSLSVDTLEGLDYGVGSGPSASQSFTISGNSLTDNIEVNAPANFEVSLVAGSGYASKVTLIPGSNGSVTQVPVYVRLKSGLTVNSYNGYITVMSPGVLSKTVSLSGKVIAMPSIAVSVASLSDLGYMQGSGPSSSKALTVSGSLLTTDIVVSAPANYEVSLNAASGYASSLTLSQSNGNVAQTTIYVRLVEGLSSNIYNGDISFTSTGASAKTVSLAGSVTPATGINSGLTVTVVSSEYYTLMGQKIDRIDNRSGVFIVRSLMSDGSIKITKVLKQR